jgi:hypothetical protein
MRGHCSDKCKRKDFTIEILYNNTHYIYYSHERKRLRVTPRPGLRTKRYTTKHSDQRLAKCKICEYITANPTKPGTRCPCCKQRLSQQIRDNSNNTIVSLEYYNSDATIN